MLGKILVAKKILTIPQQIKNNKELSDDEKVAKIIKKFSITSAFAATQPIPFADIFILTPIQLYMGKNIANIRGLNISESSVKENIKEISGIIGLGFLAQQLAIGAYKIGLPFLSGFTTIPLVYALTYGIGSTIDTYYRAKSEGREISNEELKSAFKKAKKEGKSKYNKKEVDNYIETHKKNIKIHVESDNVERKNFIDKFYSSYDVYSSYKKDYLHVKLLHENFCQKSTDLTNELKAEKLKDILNRYGQKKNPKFDEEKYIQCDFFWKNLNLYILSDLAFIADYCNKKKQSDYDEDLKKIVLEHIQKLDIIANDLKIKESNFLKKKLSDIIEYFKYRVGRL